MNVESHLDQLRVKHKGLEAQIREQERHPSADHVKITALKREKLHIKERMERILQTSH